MAHERDIIPVKWVIADNKDVQALVIQSTVEFLELQNLDSCDIIVNLVTCLLFPTPYYILCRSGMKKDASQDKWKKVPENSTPKSIECIGASQDISEIRLRRTSQLLRSDPIWKWQACNFRNRATLD